MRRPSLIFVLASAALVALGSWTWIRTHSTRLPAGLASANGRIEVERVDVATKLAGRVAELRVKEGDLVAKDAVIAQMDVSELLAQRAAARAAVNRATQGIAKARAEVASTVAQLALAEVEMKRSAELLEKAVSPQSLVDQSRAQRDVAAAAVQAAKASVADAEAARDAAQAQVDLIQVMIDDMTLKAPVAGRIEYKLVDTGAVIAGGGKVATLLDLSDVTMTIFLPTRLVGRVELGVPARIVLDAARQYVIPASVSFVAGEAQFTPKSVETADEREKLMYRVKVRIDPALLDTYRPYVKAGLTGNAYVLTEPGATWPANLEVRLPEPGVSPAQVVK